MGTGKKSTETKPWTWLFKKAFQVWEGGFRYLGMSRETVRSETSIPSLSSSPCMRGAPQYGFAIAIRGIKALSSELACRRPQYFRCEILAE